MPQIEKFYNYISNIQLLYALIIHDWFACSIDTYCKKARLDILPNGNSNNLKIFVQNIIFLNLIFFNKYLWNDEVIDREGFLPKLIAWHNL